MKKLIALILVSLTVAACGQSPVRPSPPPAPAPGGGGGGERPHARSPTVSYAVSGVVHRAADSTQAIEGAAVSVTDDFSILSATSDDQGRFSVSGVAAGTWQLTVTKDGYEVMTMTIEVAEDMTVDVELAPVPAS
jgi:Carboxypeptidase regulatory-like domain